MVKISWSYSGSPGDSDLDEVRFRAQLTDSSDQRISNEEITFILTKESTNTGAAAFCCELLSVKYASEVDVTVGGDGEFKIKASQLSEQFAKRAADLRREASEHASPWAASISVAGKEAQENRDDRVKPAFTRDQLDRKGKRGLSPEWNGDGYR